MGRESGSFLRFCGAVEAWDLVRLFIFVCGGVAEAAGEFGSFLCFCVVVASGEVFPQGPRPQLFAEEQRARAAVFGRRDSARLASATGFSLAEGIGFRFLCFLERS